MQALARVEHWVWLLLHLRQHPQTPLFYEAVSTGALNMRRKRNALSKPRAFFFRAQPQIRQRIITAGDYAPEAIQYRTTPGNDQRDPAVRRCCPQQF
jgi:hypothetical protein